MQNNIITNSTDGIVIQKTNNNNISKKEKLRNEILKYAYYYEDKLLQMNYSKEEANTLAFSWIDDTISYYETNHADALDLIISYFEQKINEKNNTKNKNKKLLIKI